MSYRVLVLAQSEDDADVKKKFFETCHSKDLIGILGCYYTLNDAEIHQGMHCFKICYLQECVEVVFVDAPSQDVYFSRNMAFFRDSNAVIKCTRQNNLSAIELVGLRGAGDITDFGVKKKDIFIFRRKSDLINIVEEIFKRGQKVKMKEQMGKEGEQCYHKYKEAIKNRKNSEIECNQLNKEIERLNEIIKQTNVQLKIITAEASRAKKSLDNAQKNEILAKKEYNKMYPSGSVREGDLQKILQEK